MSNVKNEIIIIIASNKFFSLLAEFIIAYSNQKLIDLDFGKKFNESKQLDYNPRFQLHRGFFKRPGTLNKEGFEKLAIYLL